ncbi:hypothetical protein FisN_12Lh032 [Fistulifera solaris]|uniref:Solute carrier family 15 (Peptide/histidine transporter), member 3/4 n=1 Tax=Fistulifera solaris TaxID=1519565 RepID=A0A1Z5KGS0_FISSO|nr:hypothetical protein FisN_12Lh032 [Fistulifera solaris]|eukprot:GAX25493.1 hypothetical protein FisN_12Lh032 [Fistulifera solaris]
MAESDPEINNRAMSCSDDGSEDPNNAAPPGRPLRHVDSLGRVFYHSNNPMMYSVILILLVEWFERFSYYGVAYTQTLYLTGAYDKDWNAGLSAVEASSLVSLSTAMAYTTTFIGALLADSLLGDYMTILVGCIVFYLPSLALITLTTIPSWLGDTFPTKYLAFAILLWWPAGTGIVKSCINVFGAKQFHPLLQSQLIEQYYVQYYMCINVGSLLGILIIPIIAQRSITQAYLVPCSLLCLGIMIFVSGSSRYVKVPPKGELCGKKSSRGSGDVGLLKLFRITVLIVPFCMAYSQMPTTFIIQGSVLRRACGVIDAASLNSSDAASVLVFGYITGSIIYPALAERNMKIPTTYKFAIGSALGALAILWALFVEYRMHTVYAATGESISVLWQTPCYILIGWGEIFAVSSAYEVAFTASPPSQKVLASALNIFCIGGIPNVLCIGLYRVCSQWFMNSSGKANLNTIEDYVEAHVYKYFVVLFVILLFGIVVNIMPGVRGYVESMEDQAAELLKTPMITKRTAGEQSPLLPKHLQQQSPLLYRTSSMRVGPPSLHPHRHQMQEKFEKRLQKYLPFMKNGVFRAKQPVQQAILMARAHDDRCSQQDLKHQETL